MPLTARLVLVLALLPSVPAWAGEVRVAIAANFAAPARQLAPAFEKATGHRLILSIGSTGKFYAQIKNGAPFDVLMAADQDTPARLAVEGAAVAATRFTYAIGKLVLWSAQTEKVDAKGEVLKKGTFTHLALANPRLAPYGQAAIDTLKNLGVHQDVAPKLVQGESITQAYQFVASGNAELGFVALSQILKDDGSLQAGSLWIVPPALYAPLKQDAVLLREAQNNSAALAWLQWLRTDAAQTLIRRYGYDVPNPP